MLKRISCIGNITDDTLLSVASLPELDDNAYVNKGIYCLGGRGGVVALTLAQMTENVELVTVLPDSEQAYAAQDFLGQHGVSLRGISTDYGARRMHSVIAELYFEIIKEPTDRVVVHIGPSVDEAILRKALDSQLSFTYEVKTYSTLELPQTNTGKTTQIVIRST